jgi:hypothetical protein
MAKKTVGPKMFPGALVVLLGVAVMVVVVAAVWLVGHMPKAS